MSLRMKSISIVLIFTLLIVSVFAATPPLAEAASGLQIFVGVGVVAGVVALTVYLFQARKNYVENAMQSWVGRSVEQLVLVWGPPSHTDQLPGGQNVVAYTSISTHVNPGTTTTRVKKHDDSDWETRTTITSPSTITEEKSYRMFLVSGDGIIESVSWEGLGMETREAPSIGR